MVNNVLMNQLNFEFKRLADYGDLLITVRRNIMNPKYEYDFKDLLIRFDIITDKLSLLYVLASECDNSDKESLGCCIECINTVSFIIMNFIVDLMNYKNILKSL